ALEDLEVTLGIVIGQYSKEFKEHFGDLVESRLATANIWSVYHAGFSLLLMCSLAIIVFSHPTFRSMLLPLGLVVSMVITRCCWEAQIEHVVLGRLRFALDCAVISKEQVVREETIAQAKAGRYMDESNYKRISVFSNVAVSNYLWNGLLGLITRDDARRTQALSVLYEDVDLAVELMKLPSRGLPYRQL